MNRSVIPWFNLQGYDCITQSLSRAEITTVAVLVREMPVNQVILLLPYPVKP